MARGKQIRGAHKKSLLAKSAQDKKLRKKIRNGEKKQAAEAKAMEEWARRGFVSGKEEE